MIGSAVEADLLFTCLNLHVDALNAHKRLPALARSVFYGKLGRADWRDFRRQMSTASCLLTILAAVVYWQIREIERVLSDIDPEDDVPVDLLAHISPISWDNVVLYGEYKLRPELVETGSA